MRIKRHTSEDVTLWPFLNAGPFTFPGTIRVRSCARIVPMASSMRIFFNVGGDPPFRQSSCFYLNQLRYNVSRTRAANTGKSLISFFGNGDNLLPVGSNHMPIADYDLKPPMPPFPISKHSSGKRYNDNRSWTSSELHLIVEEWKNLPVHCTLGPACFFW